MQISLEKYQFKKVQGYENKIPECITLLKKQTLNYNRAVCVVSLNTMPEDLDRYLRKLRTKVAFTVGFFPLFWGLGLQVVVICPGITQAKYKPVNYVASTDNQWAIIQSVFFVDSEKKEYAQGRTWGQTITGKYQNEISQQLRAEFTETGT